MPPQKEDIIKGEHMNIMDTLYDDEDDDEELDEQKMMIHDLKKQ